MGRSEWVRHLDKHREITDGDVGGDVSMDHGGRRVRGSDGDTLCSQDTSQDASDQLLSCSSSAP